MGLVVQASPLQQGGGYTIKAIKVRNITDEVREMSKRVIQNTLDGKLDKKDIKDWKEHGHVIIHWFREQINREVY